MRKFNWKALTGGVALMATFGFLSQGCDGDSPLGDLAAQCGLVCPAEGEGIVAGNFAISGNASIDGFFSAVVDFQAKADLVSSGINAKLAKIYAAAGFDASAGGSFSAHLQAKYELQGGVTVVFEPPRCEVSAEVMVDATAKCDVSVDPGEVSAKCEGSCTAEAGASVECDASAEVKCVVTPPAGKCEGSCSAKCEVEIEPGGASCEGECKGSCTVDVSAGAACEGRCNGTCSGSTDAGGKCDGTCEGECELTGSAAANCTGTCEGSCEFTPPAGEANCEGTCNGGCEITPPSGECEANAQVKCEASAEASVECSGKCEGKVEPPSASAECQAQVEAKAELEAQCFPPSVRVDYQFSASASLEAKAEFQAFLTVFTEAFGELQAEFEKANIVLEAGVNLVGAAEGAITASVDAQLQGELSLKGTVGLGCALAELPAVASVIADASEKLEGSVSATLDLTSDLTGG